MHESSETKDCSRTVRDRESQGYLILLCYYAYVDERYVMILQYPKEAGFLFEIARSSLNWNGAGIRAGFIIVLDVLIPIGLLKNFFWSRNRCTLATHGKFFSEKCQNFWPDRGFFCFAFLAAVYSADINWKQSFNDQAFSKQVNTSSIQFKTATKQIILQETNTFKRKHAETAQDKAAWLIFFVHL